MMQVQVNIYDAEVLAGIQGDKEQRVFVIIAIDGSGLESVITGDSSICGPYA